MTRPTRLAPAALYLAILLAWEVLPRAGVVPRLFVPSLSEALGALGRGHREFLGSLPTTVGEILVVKCFVIVVLGGLGSVPGAVAGGLLLGLVESLGAVYVSVAFKDTIGFVMFLLVLLFRPAGLFGVGRS